ncbi:hypothetical protein HNO88_004353 [Novosphingobium chloroacetimidivorans]|uniref:Uncharacterized protein n=1 Tax=Novosphingobium chloroacetimidivorans TaxID=1428314 RepID=A0A7W7NZA0_9SPHN|nr:hypothetical protein [Novosphingobium chloroacetimidivorans]MBB4861007.1 hypothetical protein [Novosphingobium chloroacetimidivorans]
MRYASNLQHAERFDAHEPSVGTADEIRSHLLQAEPGSAHARHLQQLLFEAYARTAANEKLSGAKRIAIIVGSSAALWIAILAGVLTIV